MFRGLWRAGIVAPALLPGRSTLCQLASAALKQTFDGFNIESVGWATGSMVPWTVETVGPLPGYRLEVASADGLDGIVDLSGV